MRKIILIALLILGVIALFVRGLFVLDPDLGWHLKMGEYILKNGIPLNDPFSYTMSYFPFVDHEWVANVLMYIVYDSQFWILSLLFALIAVVALVIPFSRNYKSGFVGLYALALLVIFSFAGIRVQAITWLLFAFLVKIITNNDNWKKWRFLVPVVVFAWVNMHGGFAISIVVLALLLLTRACEKKLEIQDVAVFFGAILATLINPYGFGIWVEVLSQVGNSNLRFEIVEWLPGVFYIDIAFITFCAFTFFFTSKYFSKISLINKVLFFLTLMLSFSSQRHIPLFVIVIASYLPGLIILFSKTLKNSEQKKRLGIVNRIFIIFVMGVAIYKISEMAGSNLQANNYPSGAIEYLKNQKYEGELFADYDWGGYLIWKYPEKKVFIDGRMPSWKADNPPKGQSGYAMEDYRKIISHEHNELFKRYRVEYVLLKKVSSKKSIIQKGASFLATHLGSKSGSSLEDRIIESGWKKVYEDGVAVIYSTK